MTPDRRINAAASDLTTPPTEIEIASLLSAISPFPNVALILRRLVFQRDELKVENNQLRRLVDESSRQHAAVDLPAENLVTKFIIGGKVPQVKTIDGGKSWYITDGGIGWSTNYLHTDGKWHGCCGDNGRWPTREAAEAFIRKVANESPTP